MPDIRDKRIDLILQQLEGLPTLPAVAVRILEVTASDDTSARDVVQLISSDPAMCARVLQLAHRADSGIRGDVTDIQRAVTLLGFEAVRSAVLAISVFETFREQPGRPETPFIREEFWKHCVAVACCAELLAESSRGVSPVPITHGRDARSALDPSEAFVCGLLHDLGKIALDAVLPKSFARVIEAADLLRGNIADIERTVIGVDHMVVGKRLAERWQLPAAVRDCIWLHGQVPQALPATVRHPRMVNLITLADMLVREQHLGYSGNYAYPSSRQALMSAIGLSAERVNEVCQQLVEQIEPRAAALGLGRASTTELYHQALSQANRELGRVTEQLAAKNRRLAIRAKFFDALSGFQAELHPDAPPQVVLQAIAQTAVGALGVPAAAVFSLPPGREYAETVLVDAAGEVFETSLVDCATPGASSDIAQKDAAKPQAASAGRPSVPAGGDGPVLSAGEELEWFLHAMSPRLAHDQRYWICLEADGQCIGGVVWGAPIGEAQRLSPQVQELAALAGGWSLALRTTQIREESRVLAEQLAEANRQLHNAQNELLRSKTVITVGEMAAGAAHEMNNPLAVISGRSQLLASLLEDPKHKAAAQLIHEQSHRLSQIITELMDFAKPTPPRPVEVDPAELVAKALHEAKMVTDPADRSIEVTFADVPLVTVDPQQVTAAINEVITNALQATDQTSGQITVHGAFDPYSSRVVIAVSDNGCGMDEQTLRRAFDPFFSSKSAGRRRGMGLAKALRWVETSGGSIRLESRPGQGTRALVLLPASSPPPVHGAALRKQA